MLSLRDKRLALQFVLQSLLRSLDNIDLLVKATGGRIGKKIVTHPTISTMPAPLSAGDLTRQEEVSNDSMTRRNLTDTFTWKTKSRLQEVSRNVRERLRKRREGSAETSRRPPREKISVEWLYKNFRTPPSRWTNNECRMVFDVLSEEDRVRVIHFALGEETITEYLARHGMDPVVVYSTIEKGLFNV